MNKMIHRPDRVETLPRKQFEVTEFVFDVFSNNPSWEGRTDIVASLLRPSVFPQQTDRDIVRYTPYMASTAPLVGVRKEDGAYTAEDTVFDCVGVGDRCMLVGILIHDGFTPIAHIGHALGMPMWTNGGDIILTWDRGPNKIFRL